MIKVENEYNVKYNYKRNLLNTIQKAKIILNRIERPLIEYEIKKIILMEEKEKQKNLRKSIIPLKRSHNLEAKILKENKLDSESGLFLNNNLKKDIFSSEDNYLKQNLKKEKERKQAMIRKSVKNKEGGLKNNNLKRKNMIKERENDNHSFKGGLINAFKNFIGINKKKMKTIMK